MRYYFDTEFIEDGKTIDPISIGIVAEDGRELYLQNLDCDFERASDWVGRNVYPHLTDFNVVSLSPVYDRDEPAATRRLNTAWRTRLEMKQSILDFVGDDREPEFWAYYADYDWVLLCQLWGAMINLPEHFPRFCRDLQQEIVRRRRDGERVNVPSQTGVKHNALAVALWVKATYDHLHTPRITTTADQWQPETANGMLWRRQEETKTKTLGQRLRENVYGH